jgi:hypothetical protein
VFTGTISSRDRGLASLKPVGSAFILIGDAFEIFEDLTMIVMINFLHRDDALVANGLTVLKASFAAG